MTRPCVYCGDPTERGNRLQYQHLLRIGSSNVGREAHRVSFERSLKLTELGV